MIEKFFDGDREDAHGAFQSWLARHWGDGHFLNYESPNNIMLHGSPCPHSGDTGWAHNGTARAA
jgi:hypothetical protein